jgi:hypothetical protein
MKSLSNLVFAFALVLCGSNIVKAQESLKDDEAMKKTEVKDLLNSGRYTFEATKIVSQKNASTSITPKYDLDIAKDTVIAYLPTPANTQIKEGTNEGIQFTCTSFDYSLQGSKNNGWHVNIKPKAKPLENTREIKQLDMEISALGYTTLTVTKTNSSHFSYYGYIKPHSANFPKVALNQVNDMW